MPLVSVDDIVVNEGDAFATLTLRLDSPATQVSTVTWSTSSGRASGNIDYTHLANQLVTFQPGQSTKTIQIPLLADTGVEGTEEFYVNFASTTLTLDRSFAMVTLRDNDLANRAPVASVGDVVVDETDGTAQAVIVLDRASTVPVTVTYRTVAGSAAAGSDFAARTGSVTFAAGQTTTTIDLSILNDSTAETDESFQFELTGISGVTGAAIGDGIAEITIAGNDGPTQATPTVYVEDMVYSEGAAEGYMTVTFRLSAPSAVQTSVDWYTSNGTASGIGAGSHDYAHFGATRLTFAAGETVRTVRVPIFQDNAVEGTEQFYIFLANPAGLQFDRSSQTKSYATLTLVDDDDTSRAPVASVGDLILDEADGTAHFAITLDRASSVPVTVTYRTVDGTATGGSDFVARTGSVTFNPGETAKTVDVAILNDAAAEGLEMFRFELTGISGVTGAVIGDGMADAVIALNDGPTQATPFVTVDDMVYAEAATEGFMTVTFRLSAPSAAQTSVDWYTSNGTASGIGAGSHDYDDFGARLTFAAGETVKTVRVPILQDILVEAPEQFYVNLANPVGLQVAKGFATMTLIDDDATSRAPIAAVGDVAVNESDGLAHFAITLDRASTVPVTVSYRTVDGTATGGSDFVARTGSVTFNPGETVKTVDVAILDDATGEAVESFTLKLTAISGVTDAAIGDGEAKATIGRSDGSSAATPQLTVTAIPGIEGGANVVSFLFQLSARSASQTSVDFHTQNGTAIGIGAGSHDYDHFGATRLTFAPGETLKLVQIPLIHDATTEATETFSLNLTNPSGLTLAATSVTNSILDNDGSSVSVAVVTPELVEGTGTGAKTVKLIFAREGLTTTAQTVDWAVKTTSGATVAAADFTGGVLPSGQISFAAGQSVKTVTLSIARDSVLEPDEAFNVVLSNPTTGLKLANATTAITILNDDAAPQATYAITAASADKPEGNSGTTAFTFTVTRGGSITGTGSVAWAVSGSGASPADAADFGGSLPGGTVSFAAGEVTKTVTVQVSGDTSVEADQGFSVTLSSPVGGTITTASAAGTIRNDDGTPGQTYNGTSANNTYVGGAGDDTIFGNGGNDTLSGGAGKDTIDGGIGKDKITGNAGADLLTGGAGADTFIFTALTDSTLALAGRDRIMDFSHADLDRIDLSALDADAGLAGNQAFVLVAEDFTGTPGEISVASWGTKRLVQLDVDGDGVADFALTVISATDLVAGDFIL